MWVLNSNNCRVFYLMKANGCKTIKTISMIMAKAGTSSFFLKGIPCMILYLSMMRASKTLKHGNSLQ